MLIRCTHCNHELRVPDNQIGDSGTRVLCKGCNTIFVARRPEGRGTTPAAASDVSAEILPVADDPALEAALDRILDRSPLASAAPNDGPPDPSAATSMAQQRAGEALDPGLYQNQDQPTGNTYQHPPSGMWDPVSPESLGISLVPDDPAWSPGRSTQPAPPPRAEPPESPTGGGDVDDLLDQVLRDLDQASPGGNEVGSGLGAGGVEAADEALLADLELGLSNDLGLTTSPAPAMPSEASALGLDIDDLLGSLKAAEPAVAEKATPSRRKHSRSSSWDETDGTLGFEDQSGPETIALAPPDSSHGRDGFSSTQPQGSSADGDAEGIRGASSDRPGAGHERELSLHEIYGDDPSPPLTEPVGGSRPFDAHTPTSVTSQTVAARRPRPSPSASSPAPARARETPRGGGSRRVPSSVAVLLVVAAFAAGGAWFRAWQSRQNGPGGSGDGAAPVTGAATFAIENQDGSIVKVRGALAFVVQGVVRNTSSFPVYIVHVAGVLRTPSGQQVGDAASYAGNMIPPTSLAKTPKSEVDSALDTRIGEGGVNVKIDPQGTVPFTLVFWDVPSDASVPEITVSARTFPPPRDATG